MNNLEFLHCYLHFAGETNIRISFFVYKFTNCLKKRKKKGGKVDSITTTLTRCKRLNLESLKSYPMNVLEFLFRYFEENDPSEVQK